MRNIERLNVWQLFGAVVLLGAGGAALLGLLLLAARTIRGLLT